MPNPDAAAWPDGIYHTLLNHSIRQVAYVPDAGHSRLIDRCRANGEMLSLPLTTEEEGVALLAGAWLGGDRGVLLMQSSGIGNCINLFSLTRICRMPLLMLVTMRGEAGELNPWQEPMGRNAENILTTAGIRVFPVCQGSLVEAEVDLAAQTVFGENAAAAVLISQTVIGIKGFEQ